MKEDMLNRWQDEKSDHKIKIPWTVHEDKMKRLIARSTN